MVPPRFLFKTIPMSFPPTPTPSARSFRLALLQLGGVTPNKSSNLIHAKSKIDEAVSLNSQSGKEKLDLIVLPEIFNSPYAAINFPKYAEVIGEFDPASSAKFDASTSPSESLQLLSQAAKEHGVYIVGGSIPESSSEKIYNASPVLSPKGDLLALHRKVHLFDINIPGGIVFKESETLTGGDRVTIVDTEFGKIGIAICYDLRFPELAMIAARKGCIAMIYPGAFNTTTGPLHWDLLQRARAVDNQLFVVACSPARPLSDEGYQAWGYSGVIDPMGKIVAQLDEKEGILFVDIDLEELTKARSRIPVTVQRRFDVYPDVSKGF